MKNVALVYANEALFGIFTPISFLTEANLQKAISRLENGTCDLVYIALDHFDDKEKTAAEKYLIEYVDSLEQKLQSKIFISASTKPCMATFAEYVNHIRGEVFIDILARLGDWTCIRQEIDANLNVLSIQKNVVVPTVFIRCRRMVA